MPKPTAGDVHVNAPLTNVSVAYIQSQDMYIADKVFPMLPVEKQSDLFYIYDKGDFFRDEWKKRAPGTESAGGGFGLSTSSYRADVWAYHKDVDDQMRANADAALNPDRDATEYITQLGLIRKDRAWANSFFKTGVWGLDLVGVPAAPGANQFLQFDDPTSKPASIIDGEIARITEQTGFKPNKLVLGARAFMGLKENPDIIDRVKYTQRGVITAEILAGVFDVDQVLIARATSNSAAEGVTASMAYAVDSKSALLVYAAPSPSLMQPSGGYTFAWNGLLGSASGIRIKRFRQEQLESDRIEGEMAWDQHLVSSDVATFLSACVS